MSKPHHPGFLVWNPEGRHPRYRHQTIDSAAQEAKRLAAENAGHVFYVLVPVGAAHVARPEVPFHPIDPNGHVDTRGWHDDEIPF